MNHFVKAKVKAKKRGKRKKMEKRKECFSLSMKWRDALFVERRREK